MEFSNEALLTAPIRDNEIFELLERLAATEEMFKAPVSTIRDVAELTDASPYLIARILGEMRGPGELEQIYSRLNAHEARLREVESKVTKPPALFVGNVPPLIASNNPTRELKAEIRENSDAVWKRYKLQMELDQRDQSMYEAERESRRTPITVLTVIIVLIIFVWVVASLADQGQKPQWDYRPYRSGY